MADILDGGGAGTVYDEAPAVGSYSPSTRTAAEVAIAIKRQFGDESGVQLEDSDILRWVNDAQDVIVDRNNILKAKSTTSSIPGTASYRFPTDDIQQIESLHYDGIRVPNVPFAEAERTVMNEPVSTAPMGPPTFWYEWAGQFTLWPTPRAAGQITLYYTRRPKRVTQLSDVLSVPDKYYQTVVTYVLEQAYKMDEDLPAAQSERERFEADVAQRGEEERTAQNMTFDVIQIIEE